MIPKTQILLDLVRLLGQLSRAVIENNTQDFLRVIFEVKTVCDNAISRLTFEVVELPDVDDDEL